MKPAADKSVRAWNTALAHGSTTAAGPAALRRERLDGLRFHLRHARVPNVDPQQAEIPHPWQSNLHAYGRGLLAATQTILTYTLFATYLGVGALSHDLNFSPLWAMLATALLWAAPAQMILLTALGSGGAL